MPWFRGLPQKGLLEMWKGTHLATSMRGFPGTDPESRNLLVEANGESGFGELKYLGHERDEKRPGLS